MLEDRRKLAERILAILGKSDVTFRVDIREIEPMIDEVRNDLVIQDYLMRMQIGEREIAAEWVTTFTEVEVATDLKRGLDYVVLPSTYVRFPNGEGIFNIAPAGKPWDQFIPTKPGDQRLLKNHPAFRTEGIPSYWPEATRVYFTSRMKARYPKVDLQLLCSKGSDYPLPEDLANRIFDVVVARFSRKPPQDKVVDGNDKL